MARNHAKTLETLTVSAGRSLFIEIKVRIGDKIHQIPFLVQTIGTGKAQLLTFAVTESKASIHSFAMQLAVLQRDVPDGFHHIILGNFSVNFAKITRYANLWRWVHRSCHIQPHRGYRYVDGAYSWGITVAFRGTHFPVRYPAYEEEISTTIWDLSNWTALPEKSRYHHRTTLSWLLFWNGREICWFANSWREAKTKKFLQLFYARITVILYTFDLTYKYFFDSPIVWRSFHKRQFSGFHNASAKTIWST